jgi:hypothetical protein
MPFYLKNAGVGEVELKEAPVLEPEEGQILVHIIVKLVLPLTKPKSRSKWWPSLEYEIPVL